MSSTTFDLPSFEKESSTGLKRKASFANLSDENKSMKELPLSLISRLLNLPPVLFQEIFSNYLYYNDIARFDKAVCNHADRDRYLSLLNGMVISNPFWCIRTSNQLAWIYMRQIRLESVGFGCEINEEDLCTLYPLHWLSVKQWYFEWGPSVDAESIVECLKQCTSLGELNFNIFDPNEDIFDEEYVEAILTLFELSDFCAHLRKITLGSYLFTNDATIKAISNHCHNLVHLDFGDYETSNISPEVMMVFLVRCGAHLEKLDFLSLYFFNDSNVVQAIKFCPRLTTIKLRAPSSVVMKEIGRCYPELMDLTINSFKRDTDEELIALFEGCRKIQKLCIEFSIISERALIRIFECCCDIRHISFRSVPMTALCLEKLAVNCVQLTYLVLSSLEISKADLNEFSINSRFPNLVSLYCGKVNIGDRFLLEFARKSPLLWKICLYSCMYISDVGVHHIASHCRNLTEISFSNMAGIYSPDYLIDILINNPKIKKSGFRFGGINLINVPLIFDGNSNENDGDTVFTTELKALLDSRAVYHKWITVSGFIV